MLIISRDKIFHHIHIVRASTFLAGIVRLKAKVVIIYTFDIKPFLNSISHWDRREDWKDDVVYTLPSISLSPVWSSETFISAPLTGSVGSLLLLYKFVQSS